VKFPNLTLDEPFVLCYDTDYTPFVHLTIHVICVVVRMGAGFRYSAFISYRHTDRQIAIARALQRGLAKFAVPFWRMKTWRFFRDETNLSANPDLFSRILEALSQSEHFLLMASPEAAQSRWVGDELAYWLENREPSKLIVVVTDGNIAWDPSLAQFDKTSTNVIPDAQICHFKTEPLYVDLRWVQIPEHDLQYSNPRFFDALATISASLQGIDKDRIAGEDVRRRKQFRYSVITTIAVLATLSVGLLWALVRANDFAADALVQKANAEKSAAIAEAKSIEAKTKSEEATRNAEEAERERNEAQHNLDIARKGADDLAVNLAQNVPSLKARRTEALLKILVSAQYLIDQLATAKRNDPQVQRSQFRISSLIIPPYLASLQYTKARAAAETCARLVSSLEQNSESNDWLENAGDARLAADAPREAIALYRQSLDIAVQSLDTADTTFEEEFGRLAQEARDSGMHYGAHEARRQSEISSNVRDNMRLSIKLADANLRAGEKAAAIDLYQSVLENPNLNGDKYKDLEGLALLGLGQLYFSAQNFSAALQSFEAALAKARQAPSKTEDQENNGKIEGIVASALEGIGDVQFAIGKSSDAIKSYKMSRASRAKVANIDPSDYSAQFMLSLLLAKMGEAILKSKDYKNSAQSFLESLEKSKEYIASVDDTRVRDLVNRNFDNLEAIRTVAGDEPLSSPSEHRSTFNEYERILKELVEKDPSNIRWRIDRLTTLYDGKWDASLAEALKIAERLKREGNLPDDRRGLRQNIYDAIGPENRPRVYFEIGEYDAAIDGYTQLIAINQKNGWAYQGRADAYFAKAAYEKAIADYSQAIPLNPSDTLVKARRAHAYFAEKDYDRAIEDWSELIKIPNQFWQPRHLDERGRAWMKKGDYEHAIADFNEAIQLDPEFEAPYIDRGDIWFNKGDYDRAIADYDEAIRISSKSKPTDNTRMYVARGFAWFCKGELQRAIVDYSKAIDLNPRSSGYYRLRAVSRFYSGLLVDALADLNEASKIDPTEPYTPLWLHVVQSRQNHGGDGLPQSIAQIDMTKWPSPIINLFLNQVKPADVLAAAEAKDSIIAKGQVCEANFFSGEFSLELGGREEATRLFRLAAEDCPKNFLEWAAANAELKTLVKKP
jgi:tetratricopeptide (TPR) repeat protein